MSGRQNSRFAILASLVLSLMWGGNSQQAHAQTPPNADSGVFQIDIKGKAIGTDTFTITAEGGSHATVALTVAGQKVAMTTTIQAVRGRMTEIVTEAQPGGKFTLRLQDSKGTFDVTDHPGLSQTVPVPTRLFPTGNLMPHLLAQMLANYDTHKGGAQRFDFVIVDNGGQTHGTLTQGRSQSLTLKGKPLSIIRYALNMQGAQGNVAIDLITDSQRRLLLFSVPSQGYTAVRDGYQELTHSLK